MIPEEEGAGLGPWGGEGVPSLSDGPWSILETISLVPVGVEEAWSPLLNI